MKRFLAILAYSLMTASAQANVLTFDDVADNAALPQPYHGFDWSGILGSTTFISGNPFVYNQDGQIGSSIKLNGGGTFIFNGADFVSPAGVQVVSFRGYDLTNNLMFQSNDFSVGSAAFQNIELNWVGISRLAVINQNGQYWGMDNFTFNEPLPVPEPATLGLLGLALAGIGFSRRRKV